MDHEDLGALFSRITRGLIRAERPLLDAHGLSMWAYIVLSRLARAPAGTQLALANAIGYDKTRLIGLLDELERAGLITRAADSTDRRARIVALTEAGRARHAAARADIGEMEDAFLKELGAVERSRLRRTLSQLASAAPAAPEPER
jgi:DNA-binding MarR family transcriptional regulator